MEIIKVHDVPKEEVSENVFTAPVTVQPLFTENISKDFKGAMVNFDKGVRNKLHTHDSDQILIITDGEGYVATETKKEKVLPGDIIHIPAGEKHWHGATENSAMSHIHIVAAGSPIHLFEE